MIIYIKQMITHQNCERIRHISVCNLRKCKLNMDLLTELFYLGIWEAHS